MKFFAFNLLDQESQQFLRRAYWMRYASRVLSGLAFVGIVFGVLVGAIALYLTIVEKAEREHAAAIERQPELTAAKTFDKNIRTANSLFVSAESTLAQDPMFSKLLGQVLAVLPSGVALNTIDMKRVQAASPNTSSPMPAGTVAPVSLSTSTSSGGVRARIALAGIARDRDDVLALQHALEEFPGRESVESPIENIVPPHNAKFTMTLVVVLPSL